MKTSFKFLAAIIAPLFVLSVTASYAGDDSLGLRKESSPSKQSESQRNKAALKLTRAKLPGAGLKLSAADWRTSYYSQIYSRPWWPGAPGD
jgi:hypothetical protein